mmetsp:Transcript_34490/g.72607  ORF Transcript_34490/g.72607 Transcript_34490/m.72607 type:complete len:87 (-) Transcript_34490:117-377(-)
MMVDEAEEDIQVEEDTQADEVEDMTVVEEEDTTVAEEEEDTMEVEEEAAGNFSPDTWIVVRDCWDKGYYRFGNGFPSAVGWRLFLY